MTTYYNTHMTAVPTRLLLDTNLSAEAKLTGTLLYTFEDGGLSAQELAEVLGHRDCFAVSETFSRNLGQNRSLILLAK